MKKIEIEGTVEAEWDEFRKDKKGKDIGYIMYPWILAKCPYDGEELRFDIIFANDYDFPSETDSAGECIHFSPSKYLTDNEIDKMATEINTVEAGVMYVPETMREFAEKMGWDLQWVGNNVSDGHYVFVVE